MASIKMEKSDTYQFKNEMLLKRLKARFHGSLGEVSFWDLYRAAKQFSS
ncbi:MAG: hypothetical protein ACTSRW_01245 [Candidatus Helarchaeota archaeon]